MKEKGSLEQLELLHAIEADSKPGPGDTVGGEMEESQAVWKGVCRELRWWGFTIANPCKFLVMEQANNITSTNPHMSSFHSRRKEGSS